MSDLTNLMKVKDPTPSDRRARLVEAVSYSRAVALLAEADHIEADDLVVLRKDADDEIARCVRSCVASASTPRPSKSAA